METPPFHMNRKRRQDKIKRTGKVIQLIVTQEVTYEIPVEPYVDNDFTLLSKLIKTGINAWSLGHLIDDWFIRGNLNLHHKTREKFEMKHGKRYVGYRISA